MKATDTPNQAHVSVSQILLFIASLRSCDHARAVPIRRSLRDKIRDDTMTVSKHQKFAMDRVLRSSIKPHPKNPRVITDSAKKKIKDKMSEVGLLQPLEKYKEGKNDYHLDVAIVELDEKSEAEMLVFLNNASAAGSWNTDLLAELNLDLGTTFDAYI